MSLQYVCNYVGCAAAVIAFSNIQYAKHSLFSVVNFCTTTKGPFSES